MLFLHMDVVSDRLRTMPGSRRSAIAFCWASPPQTGKQGLGGGAGSSWTRAEL